MKELVLSKNVHNEGNNTVDGKEVKKEKWIEANVT